MRLLPLSILSFLLFLLPYSATSADNMPKTFSAGGQQLVLNGVGTRTKFVISVYRAGLYLQKKSQDAKQIIAANAPMAIRMRVLSGFASAEKMKKALVTGFKKSTGGNTAPIQAQIDQLLGAAFKDKVNKGDVFDLVYTPGGGTQVLKNSKQTTVVRGLPIKQALFGIWLSGKPAQSSLKEEMLGNDF